MDRIILLVRGGFSNWAELNVSALKPMEEVRAMCVADRCKSYGRNWACPPACGTLAENAAEISAYSRGIILQTTGDMEDDFDYDAISAAYTLHKERFAALVGQVRVLYPDCLPLTAGACTLCKECTCPGSPCRYPAQRMSSMEAYGLLVSQVCVDSGLCYYYGPRTITYTSCILVD